MAERTTFQPKKRKKLCVHQSANVSYGQAQTLLAPNPRLTSTPCPTPGQTFSDYVGQCWCPDCDWSAFNAIFLNGSVKMLRFERWQAQISAQRFYAWTTEVGGEIRSQIGWVCYGGCYAIHMLDIFMKLLAGRHRRHATRGQQHMRSCPNNFHRLLSGSQIHTHRHEKPHLIWVFMHYVTQG